MNHCFQVEKVSPENQEAMIAFLRQHEHYSLFLLSNFEYYGPSLSDAPYSGNYKMVRLSNTNQVIAVFCLTRSGSILIQSVVKQPLFDCVLASCLEEHIPITGLIGSWEFCHDFWGYLKAKKIIQQETFISKEILYQIELSSIPPQSHPSPPNVRLLTAHDYPQWRVLRLDYMQEQGLPMNMSEEQLSDMFMSICIEKIAWGFFLEERLVSIADLNARAFGVGQLGGVYTDPQFRRRGYSKSVLYKILTDIQDIHGMHKLIIFTGEDNIPARKVYESVGVKHVGYFALLFGK